MARRISAERTKNWAIILMVTATLFNSAAQLLYKHAINTNGLNITSLLNQGTIIIGLLCYGISGVLLIIALTGGQASVLYPLYTLSFIWITIGANALYDEQITIIASIGMTAIIAGIILINTNNKATKATI